MEEEIKNMLDKAEIMGFDRGVRTIMLNIMKAMDSDKKTYISYIDLKRIYDQYEETGKTKNKEEQG